MTIDKELMAKMLKMIQESPGKPVGKVKIQFDPSPILNSPNLKHLFDAYGMHELNHTWGVPGFFAPSPKLADVPLGKENERDVVLSVVQKNGFALKHASEDLRDDRDIVLAAVEQNEHAFRYASERLKGDREFVLAAIEKNWGVIAYASSDLKKDSGVGLAVLEKGWASFVLFPEELKSNKDVVLGLVQKSVPALNLVPAQLLQDRAFALELVQKEGRALERLPAIMQADRDIVKAAVQQDALALAFADKNLKNDRDIVLMAVQQKAQALTYASEELMGDREIVLTAVREYGRMLSNASEELRGDREVVLAAVRQHGQILYRASDALRNDREIVLAAVSQNPRAFVHASKALQADPDIIKAIIQKEEFFFATLHAEAKHVLDEVTGNEDVVRIAVEKNGMALRYASADLQNNREVVMAAVCQHWRSVRYASKELENDPMIAELVKIEKQRQSPNKTQALNFMWLGLDLPPKPDFEDGSIRMPLPEEYIKNIHDAAKRHGNADVHLWVDSRRLTKKQYAYLEAVVEADMPNVRVKDLCSIPEYINEELYSRTETNKNWRTGYKGVIWLQVDAAKILISLQGDYDQKFFADLDHAHVDIESPFVQGMLHDQGMMIGSDGAGSTYAVENQLWGFDRSREKFFRDYYATGLKQSYEGKIAYSALIQQVRFQLCNFEANTISNICLPIGSVGLAHAEHPGHEWEKGSKSKGRSKVSASELQDVFNKRGERETAQQHAAAATPKETKRIRDADQARGM